MRKFELKVEDGIKTLEWGTWAMSRFCELCGNVPLSGLLALYDAQVFSLKHVMYMIMAAYESANEGQAITDREAGRWIDDGGGLQNPDSQILAFIRFTGAETVPDTTEVAGEEKKSD